MTEPRQANGRCPGNQNCRGTLLAILFDALWLLHSGGVMAQTSTKPGSNKGQVADLQITRPFTMHVHNRQMHVRAGGAVFNAFNHDNPRDIQNDIDSSRFGSFYDEAWREYRGKMVFEF